MLAAAGTDMVAEAHPGEVSVAERAFAPALVVAALIYALGSVSGAHFNPAVTTAFAIRGVFEWRLVPAYYAAQLVGAVASAAALHLTLSPEGFAGVTHPHGSVAQSLVTEALLTAMLVVVVLNAATEHRLIGPDAALPTGATIAAAGLIGILVSGASMNPARSLGPAIVAARARDQWLYLVGPLAGAVVGVIVTRWFRGAPECEEEEAAEGSDNH